jgi:hypothetical protein
MAWKAQPGSAEAAAQQWTSSKKLLGVIFVWLSVLYSAIVVWLVMLCSNLSGGGLFCCRLLSAWVRGSRLRACVEILTLHD